MWLVGVLKKKEPVSTIIDIKVNFRVKDCSRSGPVKFYARDSLKEAFQARA